MKPVTDPEESSFEPTMSRKVVAAMVVLIGSLMLSGLLYQILRAGNFAEMLSSTFGIALFVSLAVIPYAAAYYLFRRFIASANKKAESSRSNPFFFRLTYNLLKIAVVASAVILAIIIFQIVSTGKFNLGLTILSLQPNAILVTVLLSYLGYKFLSWFRASRDWATLFLGLAFLAVAIGTAVSDAVNTAAFVLEDPGRTESANVPFFSTKEGQDDDGSSNLKSDSRLHELFLAIQFPLRVAFVFYWIATVMLLRNYSKSIGMIRFWVLVSLPLATFVVASIFIYGGFGSLLLRGIISSAYGLVAGILFGLIFLTIARRLTPSSSTDKRSDRASGKSDSYTNSTIASYLLMSVFGVILFLIAGIPPNHIIDWVHVPYPPFADVVWSFIGFAAYLYAFGLFFSTIAISQDTRLRMSIHKLAMEEADLLRSLGATRMEEELLKRVAKISKEQEELLKEHTGIEQKISDEAIMRYTEEVVKEIQKVSAGKK